MVKTPEEYFEDHLFDVVQSESSESFTAAEAAFMAKYLGVNEAEALERLGLDTPVEPECVLSPAKEFGLGDKAVDSAAKKISTVDLSAAVAAQETVAEPVGNPVVEAEKFLEQKEERPESPAQPVRSQEQAANTPQSSASISEQPERASETPMAVSEQPAEGLDETLQGDEEDPPAWLGSGIEREPDLLEQLKQESELQMVSFFLGTQEFTVPINTVQEVIRYLPPTKLPVAPQFVRGVVNLRGAVTPIIQLRDLLGISSDAGEEKTDRFIVICKRHGLQFGLVIDTVHTMYRVPQASIDWAVESHLGTAVQYIFGLMKSDDMLIGIISVDNIVESILED
ncbi:MAG: chemotaxis protein CheW [Desulfovibrionales bacterium]|nr:chemotaxis protein CheW [Desulfovibrionales bacterium]